MTDSYDTRPEPRLSDAVPKSIDSGEGISGLFSEVYSLCRAGVSSSYSDGDYDFESAVVDNDEDADDDAIDDNDVLGIVTGADVSNGDKQRDHGGDAASINSSAAVEACHNPILCDSSETPRSLNEGLTFVKEKSFDSSFTHTDNCSVVKIPTYNLENRLIVTLPDMYRAIRESCGTCSTLRGQISKLGIVTCRLQPLQMTQMKQIGAVSLEAKCCSYILVSEFKRVIEKYREDAILSYSDTISFLPVVDVLVSPSFGSFPGDSKMLLDENLPLPCTSGHTRPLAITTHPIHTFLIKEQVAICTVELQKVFEALFGQSVSMSLVKLGVLQKKFTPLQLDEVMDFVDIDESNIQNACFYLSKKDGERVFQYAEALAGVEQINVRWMEPLKLSEDGSSADGHGHCTIQDRRTTLEKTTMSALPLREATRIRDSTSAGHHEEDFAGFRRCETMPPASDQRDATAITTEKPESPICSEVHSKGCTHTRDVREVPSSSESSTAIPSDPPQFPNHSGFWDDKSGNDVQIGNTPNPMNPSVCDQIQSSSSLITGQSSPASSTSETSNSTELNAFDSPNAIRTYLIEGEEVVCIPDIHKIVIRLYGQSVQVGYYLQRLQIPTQRFSRMQVKRLKALNALNSKATLCTYIMKSDAMRLLKMYDVFNTERKLQLIQWADPMTLESFGVHSSPCKDEATVTNDSAGATQYDEPIDPVKISTFLIKGEVVVSVPDAHKVVQVLNGQSVQVRYNMDKLGIVKRKYSYSQVYQLRAISDLKRPSMCTFITRSDADKLLMHYLTPENAPRLHFIEWLPPVKLEDLNPGEANTESPVGSDSGQVRTDTNAQEGEGEDERPSPSYFEAMPHSQTPLSRADISAVEDRPLEIVIQASSSSLRGMIPAENTPLRHSGDRGLTELSMPPFNTQTTTSAHHSLSHSPGPIPNDSVARGQYLQSACTQSDLAQGPGRNQLKQQQSARVQKRPLEETSDIEITDTDVKRLKADKEEIAATLQRKETEMTILHDAYQRQVACERERRLKVEQEAAELRASNEELLKNLQRKESEMKILHDSYQYQINKERERREELENELTEFKVQYPTQGEVSRPITDFPKR